MLALSTSIDTTGWANAHGFKRELIQLSWRVRVKLHDTAFGTSDITRTSNRSVENNADQSSSTCSEDNALIGPSSGQIACTWRTDPVAQN